MKPAFIQRYLNDPDPIMRHFARQGGRRLFSRPMVQAMVTACFIIFIYLITRLFLEYPFDNDALLDCLTYLIVGTSFFVPCVVGALVPFSFEALGGEHFLSDLKLTFLSHRRLFYYLYAGSLRRLMPQVYMIQLTLLICWGHTFVISIMGDDWSGVSELVDVIYPLLLALLFLIAAFLRPWFDTRSAILAGWKYTLTGQNRIVVGIKAFGVSCLEVLATGVSFLILVSLIDMVLDLDDSNSIPIMLLINIIFCTFCIFLSARMHFLSKRLNLRWKYCLVNLVIISLNLIPPIFFSEYEAATLMFSFFFYLIFSPFWLFRTYRAFNLYGRLMDNWPRSVAVYGRITE